MSKSTDFAAWEARLQMSHDRWHRVHEPNYKHWIDWYKGEQQETVANFQDGERITINMVYSNVKILMPRISFRRPKIFVRPRRPDRQGDTIPIADSSRALEAAINYYIEDLKIKRQMDRALLDALLTPYGCVKIGYTVESEWIRDDELLEMNEFVKSEAPYIVRWSPQDVRWDTEVRSREEARWMAFRSVSALEDLKRNPKYRGTSDLRPNLTVDLEKQGAQTTLWGRDPGLMGAVEAEFARVERWEIWDRKTHHMMVYVPGHDKFIFEDDWPFDLDGFPAEFLEFNEVPDESIGIADTSTYKDQQIELNKLSSEELRHVKRFTPKLLYQGNYFDGESLDQLERGETGSLVEIKGPPLEAIGIVPMPPLQFNHSQVKEDVKQQMREIFGVTLFDRGARENVQTATEATYIQAPSIARSDDRRSQFEDFWRRAVPKFAAVMRQFKTGEEFIPVLGADAASLDLFLKFDPAQIPQDVEKEFLFEIEIGSTEPLDDAVRQTKLHALFQLLNGDALVDQRELRRRLLEAFGERDERLLLTDKQVAEQQQIALMQAQAQAMAAEPASPAGNGGAQDPMTALGAAMGQV